MALHDPDFQTHFEGHPDDSELDTDAGDRPREQVDVPHKVPLCNRLFPLEY